MVSSAARVIFTLAPSRDLYRISLELVPFGTQQHKSSSLPPSLRQVTVDQGLNLVLRLTWLQTVLHSNFGSVDYRVTGFFLAALEVIRRGQWKFYRLENEHLNNVGKFRDCQDCTTPFS